MENSGGVESLRFDPEACLKVGLAPERLNNAESVVANGIKDGAFAGAVWIIARHGLVVRHGALGAAMRVPFSREMRTDAVFDIASITKPLFSLLMMSMIEDGRVHLDLPVAEFIPAFRDGVRQKITIRHLLTHSSGIPGQIPLYRWSHNRAEMLELVYGLPLVFEPGMGVLYTSQGFMVLDEIMRRIVGGDWESELMQRIFKPLGLERTRFKPPAEWRDLIAATEYCSWRGRVIVGEVHDENAAVMGGVAAHAGLFSTAWELAVIGQMMLNRGIYGGKRILSERAVDLMCGDHTPGLSLVRALGWQGKDPIGSPAGELMSESSFGHTGFTGTSLWIDPEFKLVVVLLTNRVHPSRDSNGIFSVRPRFHNAVCASLV